MGGWLYSPVTCNLEPGTWNRLLPGISFCIFNDTSIHLAVPLFYHIKLIDMPKFVIERDIPGVGELTQDQLQEIAQTSCGVLLEMGPRIQWIHTYVTDDKMFCIYNAPDENAIWEHSKKSGFPVDRINRVRAVFDPTAAEDKTQSVVF
jgi:hypothetical protein